MPHGVLIIEDEEVFAKNVKRYLEREDYEVWVAPTGKEGLHQFDEFKPDLVLLDLNLPDIHGLEVLQRIRERDASVKVLVITAHGGVQVAVDAMKAGAWDYVAKPVALSELKLTIDKAVGQERMEERLSYYQERQARESGLAALRGESAAMVDLRRRITQLLDAERRVADQQLPAVLIRGETGTGKELVARAIHFDGVRSKQPFVEVNCAAMPAHLIESELFGHERGAFTDARERKIGLVEAAHGGTLFLDEIGDLDLPVQVKILKLMEDRIVRRLGSVRDRKIDVRFITATHRPLEELVRDGQFRSDLYFRLRVVTLEVPPLRARGEDAIVLAEHFLQTQGQRYGKPDLRFSRRARELIQRHAWPGNVRELKNVIEQAILAAEGDTIEEANLYLPTLTSQRGADGAGRGAETLDGLALDELERRAIAQALDRCGGNVSRAARVLGITRDRLRYKLDKHGLRTAAVAAEED
jgi:two-component system, NtrC family, response regulator AtoC